MMDLDRYGYRQRDAEEYEQEEYDEYEEEASEPEDDQEEEVRKPTKEEQDFLKVREQLKEKIRQKLKKQSANIFGHSNQSQDRRRIVSNDKFGSFFGPSQPVIAPRVLEESRSIRETQHIIAKAPSSSSSVKKGSISMSTETRAPPVHDRQRKEVIEAKNKAQTLKDSRDYSFLLSDDADLPSPVNDQPAPRKASVQNSGNAHLRPHSKEQPAVRKLPSSRPDGRPAQSQLKSKAPMGKPARLVSNGHAPNDSSSKNPHLQSKLGSTREAPIIRSKPASTEPRKGGSSISARDGTGRPVVNKAPVGHKALPGKVPTRPPGTMNPPAKIVNGRPTMNQKPSAAKPHPPIQNHYSEQRRIVQRPDKAKVTAKQPLPSAKVQTSKQSAPRGVHEDRSKGRPMKRAYEDDDADAIQMIRSMFKYNPDRYAAVDDQDDSDMEVGFDSIMKEERRSAIIARREDEEQQRLIEEEEKRERMRKKQRKGGWRQIDNLYKPESLLVEIGKLMQNS